MNDEYVHFGDVVQIANLASGAVLAVDVEARDPRPAENACAVSATVQHADPCARNTFTFEKYVPRASAVDRSHLRRRCAALRTEGEARGEPRRLAADASRRVASSPSPVTTTHFSKFSRRNCEVVACGVDSYECVFEVLTPDPGEEARERGRGGDGGRARGVSALPDEPVPLGGGVLLSPTISETSSRCAGAPTSSAGNSYVMEGMATGKPQSMTQKAPGNVNVFTIVGGTRE